MSPLDGTLLDDWLVVLRPDGVVDAVEGGASVSWLGRRLEDAPGLPEAIRRAAVEVLRTPPTSRVRRQRVSFAHGGRQVNAEVLLVEALPLRYAVTSVHDLVVRTLDLFVSQAKSNELELSFELDDGIPPAMSVDREKIAWAISTIVANALRYAREHVDIHVGWDGGMHELVIDVTDDGPGIAESEARWLFDHNPATGRSAGLALLMVRDVVTAHRGAVSVRSRMGHGSTFTIRLPRLATG